MISLDFFAWVIFPNNLVKIEVKIIRRTEDFCQVEAQKYS